jgi:hypothetical protein
MKYVLITHLFGNLDVNIFFINLVKVGEVFLTNLVKGDRVLTKSSFYEFRHCYCEHKVDKYPCVFVL